MIGSVRGLIIIAMILFSLSSTFVQAQNWGTKNFNADPNPKITASDEGDMSPLKKHSSIGK